MFNINNNTRAKKYALNVLKNNIKEENKEEIVEDLIDLMEYRIEKKFSKVFNTNNFSYKYSKNITITSIHKNNGQDYIIYYVYLKIKNKIKNKEDEVFFKIGCYYDLLETELNYDNEENVNYKYIFNKTKQKYIISGSVGNDMYNTYISDSLDDVVESYFVYLKGMFSESWFIQNYMLLENDLRDFINLHIKNTRDIYNCFDEPVTIDKRMITSLKSMME